jgi:hypothetical protein
VSPIGVESWINSYALFGLFQCQRSFQRSSMGK